MPVSSILPGRVTNSLAATRLAAYISQTQAELTKLQDQLGSGRKYVLPSEAPSATLRTITLQKLTERRERLQENIQTNNGFINATDQSLSSVSDSLNRAQGVILSAVGNNLTPQERDGLVNEVDSLISGVLSAANTSYGGRPLFAGTDSSTAPFVRDSMGTIRYQGNQQSLSAYADNDLLVTSSLDGVAAFGELARTPSADLDPILTLNSRLVDLHAGRGFAAGPVDIVLDDGTNRIRKAVDLSSAETIGDVKTRLEAAFAAEAVTLTVDIDPGTQSSLRLTPSAGTVQVSDIAGGRSAYDLGLRSSAVAVVSGQPLDPRVTEDTLISSLNGGTGIGPTTGTGLSIEHNGVTTIVDLSTVTTVGDLFRQVTAADANLVGRVTQDGRGIELLSRIHGTTLSVGENGGTNATALGIRTMAANTSLSTLNRGSGVPTEAGVPLRITRRDGTAVEINLAGSFTVQDVLDRINAVDPGHLVASLKSTGNGIGLTDDSGTGALVIAQNELSVALGLNGTENSGPTGVLSGSDRGGRVSNGTMSVLMQLREALLSNDLSALNRLDPVLRAEASRLTVVRGQIGADGQLMDEVNNRLEDQLVSTKDELSRIFDVDYAEAITLFTQKQQALQATLQVAAQSQQLSILNYL
jgi:flagellar hook-associated protein 3 FlgL